MSENLYKECESVGWIHPKELVWLGDESVGKDITSNNKNSDVSKHWRWFLKIILLLSSFVRVKYLLVMLF